MERKRKISGRHGAAAVFRSLRFQVVMIMLVCYAVPVIVFGLFTNNVLLSGLREKTRAALTSGAEHAWTLTEQNAARAVEMSREAIYDGELAGFRARRAAGEIGDAEYLRLSRSYLERKYGREDLFTFAAWIPVDRPELYMYTRSGNEAALVFQRDAAERTLKLGESLDTRCRFTEYGERIYLVRNLLNLRMERYGMLILGIRREELLAPLNEIAASWPAEIRILLDGAGDQEADWAHMTPGLWDDEGEEMIRLLRVSDSGDYELKMLLSVPRRQQYRELYEFRQVVFCIYLLLLPLLGLIFWYVGRRIIRPVRLLSDASRRMEAGELGITVPLRGGDELGDLGRAFSEMSCRLRELIDRTYKEELELKNAQIQALQSRINPHFINNALEDINWQARIEGSETISAMVSSLSVLLNATMGRKDRRLVTLREELEVAEAYIYFVQQRFGTDLVVQREMEEKALDGIVPLLTVQPVLENAVEHGIAPAGGGMILLRFRRAGDCLRLEIANTGRPIRPEDREKIDAALRGEASGGNHLGLANIASRLRLIYGGRTDISVRSEEDGTTVVELEIPQDAENGEERE